MSLRDKYVWLMKVELDDGSRKIFGYPIEGNTWKAMAEKSSLAKEYGVGIDNVIAKHLPTGVTL